MSKRLLILAILFIMLILVNPLGRYERSMIFHPSFDIETTPQHFHVPYEDIFLKTQDGVMINGWFISASASSPTLLFFHGNGGNISHRLSKVSAFHKIGLNVFIVDYRGYGRSQGTPSERGVYHDAMAAYDYLLSRKDVDRTKIIGYGESLGGAVAVELARQRPLAALIIDSTFTSLPDMAKVVVPFYPRFLAQNKMDSLRKIGSLTMPKLFIHSPEDHMVPFEMGQKLFGAAAEPKAFLQLAGGHNQGFEVSEEVFVKGFQAFLEKAALSSVSAESNLP